jgi:hypothetical protein
VTAVLQPGGAPAEGLLSDPAIAAAAAALDKEGADGDRTFVRTAVQPTVAAPIDWAAEATDLMDFTVDTFVPLYPRLATVWTPERRLKIEKRLARVLEKHNLDMGRILGSWGAEIMLVAAIAPTVPASWQAIKADRAEQQEQAKEASRAAPPSGRTYAQPPPAVRTVDQGPAAAPDTTKLHEQAGGEAMAAPPPDTTQLHQKV